MSDISRIDQVSGSKKLSSKSAISMEKVEKKGEMQDVSKTLEPKQIDITMEEADHAFALMTEIRAKIETAYKELTSKLDN